MTTAPGLFYNTPIPFHRIERIMSKPGSTSAARADIHALYQASMQDADFEVEFIDGRFVALRGRAPTALREDFCGTAPVAAAWVKRSADNSAIAVDDRGEMLEWGQKNNLDASTQSRVQCIRDEPAVVDSPAVDVVTALNFAYCRIKTRAALRQYFEAVRRNLKNDGLFVLDAMGGSEVLGQTLEETELPDFKAVFIWDQEHFNPITNELLGHIHYEFDDGSELENAFTFDWRIWSLPELHEILLEAGFSKVRFYWEKFVNLEAADEDEDEDELDDEDDEFDDEDDDGDDEDDDDIDLDDFDTDFDDEDDDDEMLGTGEYYEATDVENQESWVAYIIAEV